MSKGNFLKGAAILVVANFIVKLIGVIYKIPIGNILGPDGMGYFNAAFNIYLVFWSFSTGGLPVGLSKMVAESEGLGKYREVKKIMKVTAILFSIVGIVGAAILIIFAGNFASLIGNEPVKYSVMALAPSLFFMSIMSIFRGYFQGRQNMYPTAISQIFEAFTKLIIGVSLAMVAVSFMLPYEQISAFAIFGTTASTIISAIILGIIFFGKKNMEDYRNLSGDNEECRSAKKIAFDIVKLIVPISIGSLVVNLTGFLDVFMVLTRLQDIGNNLTEANFIYGSYGYASTLFNLPISIIATLNLTILPAIATAYSLKNHAQMKSLIKKGIKITAIFAFPCAFAFVFFSNDILSLIYPGYEDAIKVATPLLSLLGIAVIFVTISSIFTAILQATGKERVPVYSILIASVIKVFLNYTLIGIPAIGIAGASISTIVCYATILFLNYRYTKKHLRFKLKMKKIILKPVVSSTIMVAVSAISMFLLSNLIILIETTTKISLPNSLDTIFMMIIAVISYFVALILVGGISKADVDGLPIPKRVISMMRLK